MSLSPYSFEKLNLLKSSSSGGIDFSLTQEEVDLTNNTAILVTQDVINRVLVPQGPTAEDHGRAL